MGRAFRAGSFVVVLVAAALFLGAAAAAAQTSPATQPRTVPTTDPQAGTFPVLQTADLPDGYRMGTGSPFRAGSQSARYPTIDKCVWNFENPFSGLTPDIYQSSFTEQAPVGGISLAVVFDADKPATAFYDNHVEAYGAAQKCAMTKIPSSTGGAPGNFGKVTPLKVGKLGDESFGVAITPPTKQFPPVKRVFIRDGSSFVSLQITDPDMTTKEFVALAKVALDRAS